MRGKAIPVRQPHVLRGASKRLIRLPDFSLFVFLETSDVFWEALDVVVQATKLSAILPRKQNDTGRPVNHTHTHRHTHTHTFEVETLVVSLCPSVYRQQQGSMMTSEYLLKVAK